MTEQAQQPEVNPAANAGAEGKPAEVTNNNSVPAKETPPAAAKVETPAKEEVKPEVNVEPLWPDDWRKRAAGEDAKLLQRLEKFASPKAVIDSYLQLEKKMAAGEHKKNTLPADATDAEKAEWRKNNNIPEKPDGYDLKLDNGYVIGEDDKPLVDKFLQNMHGTNASNDVVKAALNTYYEIQNDNEAVRKQMDDEYFEESKSELMAEYGADYKRNINATQNFVKNYFGEDYETFNQARGGDGQPLMANPNIIRKLHALAMEIDPLATVSSSAGRSGAQGVSDRIGEIEKYMKTNYNAYHKDEKIQAEYRELLGVREKLNKKA